MKNLNLHFKTYIFIVLLLLVFSSCQKEKFDQSTTEQILNTNQADLSAMKKAILQYSFNIETVYLDEEEIKETYDQWMSTLSDENQKLLVQLFEDAMRQNPSVTSTANIRTSTSETITQGVVGDGFGQSVALSGDGIYVGARFTNKVFEYEKQGGTSVLVSEIKPIGTVSDFGYSISVDGDWMAVGAPDFLQFKPGKVLMYKKIGKSWEHMMTLEGPAGNDNFGEIVELKGNQLAVVSRQPNQFPAPSMSTISVFNLNGNNWELETELEKFGYAFFELDMDENNIVAISSFFNSFFSVNVNVFSKVGGNWVDKGAITVTSFPTGALGRDLSIYGNTMVVTAVVPGNKAWVLNYSPTADKWVVKEIINYPMGASFANQWVDLEKERLAIASASPFNFFQDVAHVFKYTGNSWQLIETLVPEDGGADVVTWGLDMQGGTVALGATGGINFAGNAYIFE